jgi:hypothetical protein
MSHLAKMISLAITSQTRAFPLFSNGQYAGTILSGGRFVVHFEDDTLVPEEYQQLQTRVQELRLHSTVLKTIATFVSGDVDVQKTVEDMKTMRSLSNYLLKSDLSEDTRDNIKKECIHLRFPEKYWPINPTTVTHFLDLVSGTSPDVNDESIPLHPSYLFNPDRNLRWLSAFGYTAPSFLIPNASIISVKKGTAIPKKLTTITVGLDAAASDFRTMMDRKEIRNDPKDLSKDSKFKAYSKADGPMVWEALKKVLIPKGPAAVVTEGVPVRAQASAAPVGEDFLDF